MVTALSAETMKIFAARQMKRLLDYWGVHWIFWVEYLMIVSLFALAALMITSLDEHTLEDHFEYLYSEGNHG